MLPVIPFLIPLFITRKKLANAKNNNIPTKPMNKARKKINPAILALRPMNLPRAKTMTNEIQLIKL